MNQSIKTFPISPEIQSFHKFLEEIKEPISCLEAVIREVDQLIPLNNPHLNVIRSETEVIKTRISLLREIVGCFSIVKIKREKEI